MSNKKARIFLAADLHLNHKKIIEFGRPFKTIEEHDDTLVSNWNSVVEPHDKVFLLGDISLGVLEDHTIERLKQLNGKIYAIGGNHCTPAKCKVYAEIFEAVLGCYALHEKYMLTHIPIHPSEFDRWELNIHGHLHKDGIDDDRYRCVSMEQINYTPILIDDLVNGRNC
jgi:calcineurin-like phosphoesterase family protein